MSILIVFLAVLACARLTRLVTTDVIFEPLREKLYIAAVSGDEWDQAENRIIHAPGRKAAFLRLLKDVTSCDWCSSVWLSLPVALAAWFLPAVWFIVPALALTASHLTGLLSAVENKLYED